MQVAGQVDVIRAGKGAGEGSGGNREATASCPPGRWEEGGVCAAAGCQEPREPAPLGGARLSLARRGAGEARGALGPALRRPPALGGAAGQRDAAPWVSVQPAGRPGARPREESGCRPAGLGLHTSPQQPVDFSPGARRRERGGTRRWAPGEDRGPEGVAARGRHGGRRVRSWGLSPRAPQEPAETGRGERGLRATSLAAVCVRSGAGAGRGGALPSLRLHRVPSLRKRLQVKAEG